MAQRRAENIQNVPLSVTAVSADTLKARGVNDLAQLAVAAPSLQVGKDANYSVRGIGTLAFSTTLDTSVATAIDDVNLGKPLLSVVPFYDVAQVEVLNGPQGLLFGKNASAGLLNITTVRPKIGEFGASFDAEGTSRERPGSNAQGLIARANINIPVTSNSALRLNALYNYQQPVTRFVGPRAPGTDLDLRQYAFRAKYLWEPTSSTSIYLIGDYARSTGVAGQFDYTYRSLAEGSVNTDPLASVGITAGTHNFYVAGNAPYFRNLSSGGVQGTISHTFDNDITISNIAAWKFYKLNQQLDGDNTPVNGVDINRNRTNFNQYSDELRLTLPTQNRLTGQLGLFYYQSKTKTDAQIAGNNYFPDFLLPTYPFCVGATVTAGGPPNCAVSNDAFLGLDKNYVLDSKSYAAFGQLSYEIVDGLKLIAGGRVTHDEISIDLDQNVNPYFVVLGVPAHYDQSYSNTNFSWKVGPQFQATRDIMLYANYGQGYKGPGFNDNGATADADLTVLPETTNSFEAGVKSQFFDRRLTFNLSVFHTKFKNYQAQSFDNDLRSFVIENAASLTSKGVEVTVNASPFEGFSIGGSMTFLDTKFDDFAGAECYPGQADASCAVDGTFNAGGLRAPLAPKFTASAQASYEHKLNDSLSLVLDANLYHRSSVYFLSNHAPGSYGQGIDILGGSVGIKGDHWRASIFCKNCTNKVYPVSVSLEATDQHNALATYTQLFSFDSVRTIGLRFGYDF
ncbi:TonB-dependent receptor [Novosphingobium sp. KA1]|uniref:TonB-dependent receptor n=1 Tax=Novosphingobium sp. (strain KA1) TaxID=164608 RepID=UPI001F5C0DE0|nr:TonB-dependent receptor [Novosphingobium sp. KA1]